jgi:hypothetical protein
LEIKHTGQAGYRHEGQQSGDNKEKQVVAGINGRKTEQQSNDYVYRTSLADPQTKGSGMSAIILRSISPRLKLS